MLWPSFWTLVPGPFKAPETSLVAGGPVVHAGQHQ